MEVRGHGPRPASCRTTKLDGVAASETVGDPELDEVAATEARARYRAAGMTPLDSDARIAPLIRPGEQVLAVHHGVRAESRAIPEGSEEPIRLAGDLYLTSARLVLVDGVELSFGLDRIEEAVLSGEHLLLVMQDGAGLSIAADQPRLLRVQISAARSALRASGRDPATSAGG
jgi:hypothetical protein